MGLGSQGDACLEGVDVDVSRVESLMRAQEILCSSVFDDVVTTPQQHVVVRHNLEAHILIVHGCCMHPK